MGEPMPRFDASSNDYPLPPSLPECTRGCMSTPPRPPHCGDLVSTPASGAADIDGSVVPGSGSAPPPRPRSAGQRAESGQAREVRSAQVGRPPPTLVSRQ